MMSSMTMPLDEKRVNKFFYTKLSCRFELDKFWNILSTNEDSDGVEFISTIEVTKSCFFSDSRRQFFPRLKITPFMEHNFTLRKTSLNGLQNIQIFLIQGLTTSCFLFTYITLMIHLFFY